VLQRRVYARVLSSPSFQHYYFYAEKHNFFVLAKINRFRPTFIGAIDRKKVGRNSVLPSLDITKKSPKRLNKKKSTKWMRKNDVHLFFEQRLSVTSEINSERDTIFHEQNAVVFRGCVFSVGVVFNRHHAFVERTKFRIQSRANESRN
jgi:hypothetical protein